ncbi:MAG: D-glycerate dehydrogenase [Phycisphaerales bacterium]|nr:D-glycerate dehydrogenase [Phycisphaerales bacterium]
MKDARIVITRPLCRDAPSIFRKAGFENVWCSEADRALTRAELLDAVRGAHAVLATPADTEINHEFFDAAGDQLVVVSNYAVGVDNIDLPEAARRNVRIGHTPHAVTEPTADIAWLLIIAAARRAYEGERLVRSGGWTGVAPCQLLGHRLHRSTLFIVGAGRIGYATARRALGWDMTILYHARSRHEDFEAPPINARRVTLDEGLREADIVSLHVPLKEDTHHLIGASELDMMKSTAILVNTARGAVVDEAALVSALRNRDIAAAGLDVFEHEPALHPDLASIENCTLLPHLGTATHEDREWMLHIAVDNVIAALTGAPMPYQYADLE